MTMSISLDDLEQIGTRIRQWRQGAGISQRQLAERLGTSQPAVSRWEHGHDLPRLSTLTAILRECGLAGTLLVDEGVDRTQILQHLAMTPRERLQTLANVSRMTSLATRVT